jgi:hypothetical protein
LDREQAKQRDRETGLTGLRTADSGDTFESSNRGSKGALLLFPVEASVSKFSIAVGAAPTVPLSRLSTERNI